MGCRKLEHIERKNAGFGQVRSGSWFFVLGSERGYLFVDPMSDDFPDLTPYAYCANNPMMYIDPDGMEFISFDNWFQINPPRKKDQSAPNSSKNPYELDPIEIKIPKQESPKPPQGKQKAGSDVIPIPWILGVGTFLEQVLSTVVVTASTTVLGTLSVLTVLLSGDTRPGQRDQFREHDSNKSPSKLNKHQNGQARKKQDRQGSKGEKLPPRKRPDGYKGPYPPREELKH